VFFEYFNEVLETIDIYNHDYIKEITSSKDDDKKILLKFWFNNWKVILNILNVGEFELIKNEIIKKIGISENLIEIGKNYICFIVDNTFVVNNDWSLYIFYQYANRSYRFGITIRTKLLTQNQLNILESNSAKLGRKNIIKNKTNYIILEEKKEKFAHSELISDMKKNFKIIKGLFE
jgi:hypothetical protein